VVEVVVKKESTITASTALNPKPLNNYLIILSGSVMCSSNEVAGCKAAAVEASASTSTTEAAKATLAALLTALLTTLLAALLTSLLAALLATLLAALLTVVLPTLLTVVLTVVLSVVLAAVVTAVVATVTSTNCESYTVILRTTLSNGHDNRLMVGGRGDRASTVVTGRETSLERGSEKTIAVTSVVDTLEESKVLSIRRVVGVVTHVLDGDMGVANDVASLKRLRGSVVGVVRVGERTGLQVGDLHGEVNLLVFLDALFVVLGAGEDRRNHVTNGRNISHDDTVAGSLLDLETVGEGLALAEVDEVGLVSEGRGLSIFLALVESIGLTGGLNNIRVEGQVTTTTAVVASVVTTVVAAVVLTVVLTVVASVLAVVLSVVAAVLTVVLTVVSTLAAKLGIGNTGCKQHRDEG